MPAPGHSAIAIDTSQIPEGGTELLQLSLFAGDGLVQNLKGHHLVGAGDGLGDLLEVAEGAQLGAEGVGGGQVGLDSGGVLVLSHSNFPFCPAIVGPGRAPPGDALTGVSAHSFFGSKASSSAARCSIASARAFSAR